MIALHAALFAAAAAGPGETPAQTVALTFKPVREWNLLLPDEHFSPVGPEIAFPHLDGREGFAVELEGTALRIDRDGDGTVDVKVEPKDEQGETSLVVFKNADGLPSYAVRLLSDGKWSYAPSGAMVGRLGDQPIQLIDQNNNGRFDDYGEDAMVVGRGTVASFLSKVVNIGGELLEIEVAADGTRIDAKPYEGPVGELDFASERNAKAKIRAAVVKSRDGQYSFDLGPARGAVKVPAGRYSLQSGQVVLGKGTAELERGRFRAVEVTEGERTSVAFGGPLKAEFDYYRQGNELAIAPDDIHYYGAAGERYSNFLPLGESPVFTIKDKETGETLVETQFPGST